MRDVTGVEYFNFGKHLQQATLADVKDTWLCFYATEIVQPVLVVLIKWSIVLLLYRVLDTPQAKLYDHGCSLGVRNCM